MNTVHKWGVFVLALCIISLTAAVALADPLPGEVLKFKQAVQDGTTVIPGQIPGTIIPWPYFGHDEESSAWIVQQGGNTSYDTRPGGQFMADDFQDTVSTPVVHVQWWGSYLNNSNLGAPPALLPNKFLIAWESDVPTSTANPFSHPGSVLQTEIVQLGALSPGSGTYTEKLWQPAPIGPVPADDIYVYNAELALPFAQQANTVYWLKIVALFDQPFNAAQPPVIWGWHNRDYTQPAQGFPTLTPAQEFDGQVVDSTGVGVNVFHYLDDAVNGQMTLQLGLPPTPTTLLQTNYQPQNYVFPDDGPRGIELHSKDLAFALYTIPEPSTLVLAGMGALGLIGYAVRRKK